MKVRDRSSSQVAARRQHGEWLAASAQVAHQGVQPQVSVASGGSGAGGDAARGAPHAHATVPCRCADHDGLLCPYRSISSTDAGSFLVKRTKRAGGGGGGRRKAAPKAAPEEQDAQQGDQAAEGEARQQAPSKTSTEDGSDNDGTNLMACGNIVDMSSPQKRIRRVQRQCPGSTHWTPWRQRYVSAVW